VGPRDLSAVTEIPGPARALAAVYAVFALAAGARSVVQLATHASRAPLAYVLSAFAAAVYLVATVALRRPGRSSRQVALAACSIELAGVLIVGTLSLVVADAFPDETVWSRYGQGYGHLPLVLPLLGLAWLWHAGRRERGR
jgi:hypothetical protein